MTNEERAALVERVALLPDGDAWPSTVVLLCDLRDQIEADGKRIEELEREKAAVSDLLEQREELAMEYLFDCNREAGKVAYLEQKVEIARKCIEELEIEAEAQYHRGYYDGRAALAETFTERE